MELKLDFVWLFLDVSGVGAGDRMGQEGWVSRTQEESWSQGELPRRTWGCGVGHFGEAGLRGSE